MYEQQILELARNQLGLVTRRQLVAVGISNAAVSRSIACRWLHRLLPGVFLVAPAADTFEMRCRAVNLWAPDGFVSGRSAGRLHGLMRMGDRWPIHYTVGAGGPRTKVDWVELHHTGWTHPPSDRTRLECGTVAAEPHRMLFGLAAEFKSQRWVDAVADDAWNSELLTPASMGRYLDLHRCRGKDGVIRLERWLERALEQESPSQSHLERDVIDALVAVGLPAPVRQFELELGNDLGRSETIRIDIAWPALRLGVEPGHSRFHEGESAVERDNLRDLACAEQGWTIIRATHRMRRDLPGFARRVASAYRQRRRDLSHPNS